jgi:probable DNA repair protein
VVSWPEHDGDRSLDPSPLILAVEPGIPGMSALRLWVRSVYEARVVEHFTDDDGPVLDAGTEVRGGAALFKDQAACPFRAFAHHRLGARSLDAADLGLDAMERGSLVHRVLELIWQALGTQQQLLSLPTPAVDALIHRAVDEALAPAVARRPQTFTERFTSVERGRLRGLVREWLDVERGRPPFAVVACEQSRNFRVGGIDGQLRVDRLDRLDDGRLVVIDYKTGNVPARPWDGGRPEEPQLPLYAITGADAVAAVAFARLRAGASGFKGMAAAADMLPEVKAVADWGQLQTDWRRTLIALAAEFERGHAAVAPRDGEQTCRTCDLHSFCRVHELAAAAEAAEDDDNGD